MTEPTPVDRFSWERALRADPHITGNRLLVLLAIGTFMNAAGADARPSQAALAGATGLRERAVRGHLAAAVRDGFLIRLQRGHRLGNGAAVASTYRASLPQPASGDRLNGTSTGTGVPIETGSTGTGGPVDIRTTGTDMPVEESQPANGSTSTGTPVPPTTSFRPRTTSPARSTQEGPASEEATKAKRPKVTRRLLWKTMAERELELARESGRSDLPPPNSNRERGYLRTLAADFETQHDAKALTLVDRLPANDLERWIYELDPRLSRHGWGPHIARSQAEHEAAWAETDARLAAMTDEERASCSDILAATKADLARRRRADHEEAIPA